MARIRSVKPEYWSSPGIEMISPWARLLYIAMWNWADDAGRGTCNLRELQAFAFPFDDCPDVGTSEGFRHTLSEVRGRFGVVFYRVGGRCYFAIPSWRRHQRNERLAQSRHPGPDDGEPWDFMASDQRSDGTSDNLRDTSAEAPAKDAEAPQTSGPGTGEQGNRGTDISSPASRARARVPQPGSDDDPDWVKFWETYPKKVSKAAARKKWAIAVKKAEPSAIIAGAERYRDLVAAERRDKSKIKDPDGWLHNEKWTDEDTRLTTAAEPSGAWWDN